NPGNELADAQMVPDMLMRREAELKALAEACKMASAGTPIKNSEAQVGLRPTQCRKPQRRSQQSSGK
ncbi:Hypothetical predicted protein, partial [Pelobates cultripes]